MNINALAAKLLGWTEEQASGFSIRALRDVVRAEPPSKLRDEVIREIDTCERTGRVVVTVLELDTTYDD